MTIDLQKMQFTSELAGLGQGSTVTGTVTIPSQYLGPSAALYAVTAIPLTNPNSITHVDITCHGNIYWLDGYLRVFDVAAYDVYFYSSYKNGALNILMVVYDNTGTGQTIPTITGTINAAVFNAPF